MANFSDKAISSGYSDAEILEYFDRLHVLFSDGDKLALFKALELCARFQAVMPEWVADEIIEADKRFDDGSLRDFGEVFGVIGAGYRARVKAHRIREIEGRVIAALHSHRVAGGNFNIADGLEAVAERVGVTRREVEAIYQRNPSMKDHPKEGLPNTVSGTMRVDIPRPRRRGRSTF